MKRFSLSSLVLLFALAFVWAASAGAGTLKRAQEQKPPQEKELRRIGVLRVLELMQAELEGTAEQKAAAQARAVAAYDDLLAMVPDDMAALNMRGSIKEKISAGAGKADFESVIAKAEVALKAAPEEAEVFHARAGAYRGLKQFELARKDYQEAIRLKPDSRKWAADLRAMELEARDAAAAEAAAKAQRGSP